MKYHWSGKQVTVQGAEEEARLGGGWANTPGAFDRYKKTRRGLIPDPDPTKWVDAWQLPGLSADGRKKVKAQLLRADCMFEKSEDCDRGAEVAMRKTFEGIAGVLLKEGLLTEEIVRMDLPEFVWDSAIAGGWWRWGSEKQEDIFPERLGRYWVWRDENRDWKEFFRAETAACLANILEAPPRGLGAEERIIAETKESELQLPGAAARRRGQKPRANAPATEPDGKRGRRPNDARRRAIQEATGRYGEDWRDHLSEIYEQLDDAGIALESFAGMKIDLGDGKSLRVSAWKDLDYAKGDQRTKIIDVFRKYAPKRK